MSEELRITLSEELVERIANRAAEVALPRLRAESRRPSRWLTVAEAADYARCNEQRIYDLRSDGRLTKHGDGGRALVDRQELDALIAAGRRRPR